MNSPSSSSKTRTDNSPPWKKVKIRFASRSRLPIESMIATRRLTFNIALDRALELCRQLVKPPLIFEALSSVLDSLSYLERKKEPRLPKPMIPNTLMLNSRQVADRKPTVIPNLFRTNQIDSDLLRAYTSQTGQTLAALAERPLFLVFLRHFGCTFCREAVADLAGKRQSIEAKGAPLAFVHLGHRSKSAVVLQAIRNAGCAEVQRSRWAPVRGIRTASRGASPVSEFREHP